MSSPERSSDPYDQLLNAYDEALRFPGLSRVMMLSVGMPPGIIQSDAYMAKVAELPDWTAEERDWLAKRQQADRRYRDSLLGNVTVKAAIVPTSVAHNITAQMMNALTDGFIGFNTLKDVDIRYIDRFTDLHPRARERDVTVVSVPSLRDPRRNNLHVFCEEAWPVRDGERPGGSLIAIGFDEARYFGPDDPETVGWKHLVGFALTASEPNWRPEAAMADDVPGPVMDLAGRE